MNDGDRGGEPHGKKIIDHFPTIGYKLSAINYPYKLLAFQHNPFIPDLVRAFWIIAVNERYPVLPVVNRFGVEYNCNGRGPARKDRLCIVLGRGAGAAQFNLADQEGRVSAVADLVPEFYHISFLYHAETFFSVRYGHFLRK
jgi:hypothetical protein